jgi:hypothetical protein
MRFPVNSSFMGRGPFVAIYHKKTCFLKVTSKIKAKLFKLGSNNQKSIFEKSIE